MGQNNAVMSFPVVPMTLYYFTCRLCLPIILNLFFFTSLNDFKVGGETVLLDDLFIYLFIFSRDWSLEKL